MDVIIYIGVEYGLEINWKGVEMMGLRCLVKAQGVSALFNLDCLPLSRCCLSWKRWGVHSVSWWEVQGRVGRRAAISTCVSVWYFGRCPAINVCNREFA